MENLKALLAVAFFIASLIFAGPMINNSDSKAQKSRKNYNYSIQPVYDTTTTNQSQYTLQPDIAFNHTID